MKRPIGTRRHLVAALTIAVALSAFPAMHHRSTAEASAKARRKSSVATKLCPFDWRRSTWQVKQLIKCAAHRWHVPGGRAKALSVANCESHFNPKAYNPSGYAGVFQQSTRYWPGRARTYGFPEWSVRNGRANVMVSIRIAHRGGWRAWGCA